MFEIGDDLGFKKANSYLSYPDEERTLRYVMQEHWRGSSVHVDFRFTSAFRGLLGGFTLMHQIADVVKKPVLTLEDAKRWARSGKHSKIIWEPPGSVLKRKTPTGKLTNIQLLASKKKLEPEEWEKIEGVIPAPKQPGEKVRPGATRFFPGVMLIRDLGTIEYGALKSYYVELFLKGKIFKRRVVLRLLENVWKELNEDDAAGLQKELKGLIKAGEILRPPAASEDRTGREDLVWQFMLPEEQTPYVLTEESLENWNPPEGVSALPKAIREKVPAHLHYWKMRGRKAVETRRDLIKLIEAGDLDLGIPERIEKGVLTGQTIRFVFQHHWFRGQKVIRAGPSTEHWDLRIERPNDLYYLVCNGNILEEDSVTALEKPCKDKSLLDIRGTMEVKPGTQLNPTKKTPAWLQTLDYGKVTVIIDDPGFKKFKFSGRTLKGLWVWEAETEGSKIGLLKRSNLPEPK